MPALGDHSQGLDRSAEFDDSYLVRHLVAQVKDTLSQAGNIGALIRTPSQDNAGSLMAKAIGHIAEEVFLTRVSCSEFSQNLNCGALLFLLAEGPLVDTENDTEVLFAVKRYFQKMSGAEPSIVLVDHAHLLDARSEWILSRLAITGLVQLILRTDQPDELGTTFSELLRQPILVNLRTFHMNQAIFDDFLNHRLAGKISAQARTHYLVTTENDLSVLARLVETDLASNILRKEHDIWILDVKARDNALQTRTYDASNSQVMPQERELFRRLETTVGVESKEIMGDPHAQATIRRLFADGLVENSGTGSVRLKDHQKRILSSELYFQRRAKRNNKLVSQGLGASGGETETALKTEPELLDSNGGKNLNLSKYTHLMAAGDLDATRDLLAGIKFSLADLTDSPELAVTEYTIFNWYLLMRSGGWPTIWHSDTSEAGIRSCIYDERWRDESNQLLGVLLTAYCWSLEGKLTAASKLLRWAIEAFKNSDSYLRDERFRLWYPHIAFMSYIVAFNMCQWRVMDTLDEMVSTDAYHDLTAAGIKEFFSALRSLTHGRVDASKVALDTVMAQATALSHESDRAVQRDVACLLDEMSDWEQHERFLMNPEEEIPSPSRSTHWSHAYLRLLRHAYVLPPGRVGEEAQDYIAACLTEGHLFSACMAASVSLNVGEPIKRDMMQRLVDETRDDFSRTVQLLNEALLENDLDSAVDVYCQMASTGMYFCVDLPMKRLEKLNPIQRRKMQRAVATLKGIESSRSYPQPTGGSQAGNPVLWHTTLTKRERSIATMAAQGLHNAELAEQFGISVRTVEGHLYRALEKLGLRSRRELSALIANQDQEVL